MIARVGSSFPLTVTIVFVDSGFRLVLFTGMIIVGALGWLFKD